MPTQRPLKRSDPTSARLPSGHRRGAGRRGLPGLGRQVPRARRGARRRRVAGERLRPRPPRVWRGGPGGAPARRLSPPETPAPARGQPAVAVETRSFRMRGESCVLSRCCHGVAAAVTVSQHFVPSQCCAATAASLPVTKCLPGDSRLRSSTLLVRDAAAGLERQCGSPSRSSCPVAPRAPLCVISHARPAVGQYAVRARSARREGRTLAGGRGAGSLEGGCRLAGRWCSGPQPQPAA
jgi:hypothetical protein